MNGYGPEQGRDPQLRIGDADREAAVTALGEHYAAGRLTKEEYDERSDRAYAARTAAALRPLFADLPGPERPTSGGRPGPDPRQRRSGFGWAAVAAPVLVVFLVLTVLTHLPFLLIGFLVWLLVAKASRRWPSTHGRYAWRQHQHQHQHGRW